MLEYSKTTQVCDGVAAPAYVVQDITKRRLDLFVGRNVSSNQMMPSARAFLWRALPSGGQMADDDDNNKDTKFRNLLKDLEALYHWLVNTFSKGDEEPASWRKKVAHGAMSFLFGGVSQYCFVIVRYADRKGFDGVISVTRNQLFDLLLGLTIAAAPVAVVVALLVGAACGVNRNLWGTVSRTLTLTILAWTVLHLAGGRLI